MNYLTSIIGKRFFTLVLPQITLYWQLKITPMRTYPSIIHRSGNSLYFLDNLIYEGPFKVFNCIYSITNRFVSINLL